MSDTWQTIETAPMDGTLFLACNYDPAKHVPTVIYRESGSVAFYIRPHWRTSTHEKLPDGYFTHWMPLPTPPEQQK